MSPSLPTSGRLDKPGAQEALGAANVAAGDGNFDDTTETTIIHTPSLCDGRTTPPSPGPSEVSIKLSKKRWFVLFALAVFGLSMALAGDTSSILTKLLNLLDLKVDQYIYISQIYHYCTLVLMGPTAIFVDKFGIRAATHTALGFFVLNGLFKTLLYFTRLPGWSACKMYYYLASCFFGTETYLLFILLPLKVSETWFSVSERSVAWTVLMLQYDVASVFASFLYPRLIHTVDDFRLLAYIYIVAVAATAVVVISCVTRSAPDHPPSLRMAEASKDNKAPFLVSVRKMIRHKDIMLQVIHGGIQGSLLYSVGIVLQDIMTSIGFSSIFVGNYMSLNAIVAIIMLLAMSTFVHKVDNPLLACKLGSFLQSALFIAHLVTLRTAAPGWVIVSVAVCATVCRSFTSPHFNNITAHMACGTVSQATIVGFGVIVGTVLISVVQTSFAYLIEAQHGPAKYRQSLMLVGVICVINEVIYQLFFQGKTAARQLEGAGDQQQQQQQRQHQQTAVENAAYEHDPEEAASAVAIR